jgi:murein L,D-transpeptidase YcbB/YkuD
MDAFKPGLFRVDERLQSTSSILKWLCIAATIACFLQSALAKPLSASRCDPAIQSIQSIIKDRLNGERDLSTLFCQGEMICGIRLLPSAYRHRDYRPLWIDASLHLGRAQRLTEAIHHAGTDGLNPYDYHLDAIDGLLEQLGQLSSEQRPMAIQPELWADLDLMLTDAFLLVASHLAAGRVNPETLHTDWVIDPGDVDLLGFLDKAASSGEIESVLDALRPAHDAYKALRKALSRLRDLDAVGGWPVLDKDNTLRPGDRRPVVDDLRKRLIAEGDLDPTIPVGDVSVFDGTVETAVVRFQQRHGLETDGIVGPATYAMLGIPVTQRIRQVVLNLERWRWLNHDLGRRYIMVNTADFRLKAIEDNRELVDMRVVVGRPARRSPVFSARMTYLVANPYWNIPTSIAVKDFLPELRKDISYLTQRGIRVFANWTPGAPELDPVDIDWYAYDANRFPFKLRQDPGPHNALGRIKFMFPNRFAVYLHDTPNRSLFNRVQRDFSSGCIRVEAPEVLADFVLKEDKRWTPGQLNDIVASGKRRVVRLSHPVRVHLLYMTAWVDNTAVLHFRSDIYDRDQDLDLALNRRRPATASIFSRPAQER